jgi:hypothetical protein
MRQSNETLPDTGSSAPKAAISSRRGHPQAHISGRFRSPPRSNSNLPLHGSTGQGVKIVGKASELGEEVYIMEGAY